MNCTSTFFNSVTQLLYPKLCPGCGTDLLSRGQLICIDCSEGLPVTGFYDHTGNPAEKIFRGRLELTAASSYVYFTKQSVMQNLLHQFKYRGNKEIGLYFGRRMGEQLIDSLLYKEMSALIPLPLFFKKEKKRGYNQATVICEGMAEVMQIPVLKNVVERKNSTETQTRKSRVERWDNISGKFELVNSAAIEGRSILLVDDVLTTGATLEACGSELLKAKGTKLGIVTLAYTSL